MLSLLRGGVLFFCVMYVPSPGVIDGGFATHPCILIAIIYAKEVKARAGLHRTSIGFNIRRVGMLLP